MSENAIVWPKKGIMGNRFHCCMGNISFTACISRKDVCQAALPLTHLETGSTIVLGIRQEIGNIYY